jgi:Cu/Ag efflux pump CusA
MRIFTGLQQHRKPWVLKNLLVPCGTWEPETPLTSKGYRPLRLTFDDQLKALVSFHLKEFPSARALIQALKQNNFAKDYIAPPDVRWLQRSYRPMINLAVARPGLVIAGSALAFALAMILAMTGRSFLSAFNEGALTVVHRQA